MILASCYLYHYYALGVDLVRQAAVLYGVYGKFSVGIASAAECLALFSDEERAVGPAFDISNFVFHHHSCRPLQVLEAVVTETSGTATTPCIALSLTVQCHKVIYPSLDFHYAGQLVKALGYAIDVLIDLSLLTQQHDVSLV